jgi:hypothetical protein
LTPGIYLKVCFSQQVGMGWLASLCIPDYPKQQKKGIIPQMG